MSAPREARYLFIVSTSPAELCLGSYQNFSVQRSRIEPKVPRLASSNNSNPFRLRDLRNQCHFSCPREEATGINSDAFIIVTAKASTEFTFHGHAQYHVGLLFSMRRLTKISARIMSDRRHAADSHNHSRADKSRNLRMMRLRNFIFAGRGGIDGE